MKKCVEWLEILEKFDLKLSMYSFYVYKINCENEQSILLYNYSLISFYQYMFKLLKSYMVIIIVYYEQLKVHIYYLHVLSFLFFMVVARDFFFNFRPRPHTSLC